MGRAATLGGKAIFLTSSRIEENSGHGLQDPTDEELPSEEEQSGHGSPSKLNTKGCVAAMSIRVYGGGDLDYLRYYECENRGRQS